MAYSKQTWDTTSYVKPTRMNHIEDGIEAADSKTADDIEYSTGVSVKDKIDDIVNGEEYVDTSYGNNRYFLCGKIVHIMIETRNNLSFSAWENKQIGQLPTNMSSPYSIFFALPMQGATNEQRNVVLNVNGRTVQLSNQSGSAVTVNAVMRGMYSFYKS